MSSTTHPGTAFPARPQTTAATARRVARRLLREWGSYLLGGLLIAALIVLARLLGLVHVIGERPGSWWGVTGVSAMSIVITTLVFSLVVPGTHLRPGYAAGATRTAMGVAWAAVAPVVLVTGALAVAAVDLATGALASAGLGRASSDASIVLDLPGLPADLLASSLLVMVPSCLAALVLGPTIIALCHRFPWWVGTILLVGGLAGGTTTVDRLAVTGPSTMHAVAAAFGLVVACVIGWVLLRTVPIRPASQAA